VPDPSLPFLGVHLTKRLSGEVWAGPNAVLAFAREGYRTRDLVRRDLWETLSYRGFRALAARHWRVAWAELSTELSRRRFADALRRFLPAVAPEDLLAGHSGVRAQALGDNGELLDDFWIDRTKLALHVRNAPSPAATSSLALAQHIADEVELALAG